MPREQRPPWRSRCEYSAMSPCLRDSKAGTGRSAHPPYHRAGFTLIEMLIAASILAFSAATISGVMLAVNEAWTFSTALEDGRRQAQSSLSRIKWMVQQAGTYEMT